MQHEMNILIKSKDGYKEPVLVDFQLSNDTVFLTGLRDAIKASIEEYMKEDSSGVYFKERE